MININEILSKHSPNYKTAQEVGRESKAILSATSVKSAIKEIVEKVLEEASENAKINEHYISAQEIYTDNEFLTTTGRDNDINLKYEINKQSILDTINKIQF